MASDFVEVIPQATAIQVGNRGSGHGPQFRAQSTPLLKQPRQLFRACFPARATDSDVVSAMLVVPDMMHIPTALHLNDGYITSRFDISNNLEVRDDLGTNLVAARLHYPFFQPLIRASLAASGIRLVRRIKPLEPQHIPAVIHPQEDTSTLKVGKCDHLLRQLAQVGCRIVLALDAGVFDVRDQLEELCLCHGSILRSGTSAVDVRMLPLPPRATLPPVPELVEHRWHPCGPERPSRRPHPLRPKH